mmetsp:Transcript_36475/g.83814  ORF Transcript_36475/g.83814 Transcript_36475/m.83814 type:complete len:370 (+) Transcript_36475:323-1432(+)
MQQGRELPSWRKIDRVAFQPRVIFLHIRTLRVRRRLRKRRKRSLWKAQLMIMRMPTKAATRRTMSFSTKGVQPPMEEGLLRMMQAEKKLKKEALRMNPPRTTRMSLQRVRVLMKRMKTRVQRQRLMRATRIESLMQGPGKARLSQVLRRVTVIRELAWLRMKKMKEATKMFRWRQGTKMERLTLLLQLVVRLMMMTLPLRMDQLEEARRPMLWPQPRMLRTSLQMRRRLTELTMMETRQLMMPLRRLKTQRKPQRRQLNWMKRRKRTRWKRTRWKKTKRKKTRRKETRRKKARRQPMKRMLQMKKNKLVEKTMPAKRRQLRRMQGRMLVMPTQCWTRAWVLLAPQQHPTVLIGRKQLQEPQSWMLMRDR